MTTIQTSDFNPWEGIRNVSSSSYYASKRVDEVLNPRQRDLHWSLNETGNPALLIGYDADERCADSMPYFKGIATGEDRQRHLIVIALQDSAMRDAFLKVCIDIISVLQNVPKGQQRHAVIIRLERWAYFFRGKKAKLTEEEQKGLIAELVCLQRVTLKMLEPKAALRSWVGPQRAVHDFVFGQTSIEVKSNRGAGTPNITISSSSQLSVNDDEALFLYVVEVNQASSPTKGAHSPITSVTRVNHSIPLWTLLNSISNFRRLAIAKRMTIQARYGAWGVSAASLFPKTFRTSKKIR